MTPRLRVALAIALGLAFAVSALPQAPAPSHETPASDALIWWKWANFAILAAGLGVLIGKHAPGLFRARSREIEQTIAEAAKVKQDAEARAAEIHRRLADLQHEIENLRGAARAEMAAESDRIKSETEQRLRKIQDQAAQQIALLSRAARAELRKYSAGLALDLAAERLGSRMTKDAQDGLVDGFLQDLRYRVTPDART